MRSSALKVVVMLLGALSLVQPAPAGSAPQRDTVVIGMAQEPDILGEFSIMSAEGVIRNVLWAYVAPFNEKWVRSALMAEKLPTIKDGDWVLLPNRKMRVTWKLKRGFTWHDGKPVTALDWRFTYGMLRNPRVPQVSRFIVNKVDNILVPNLRDPYTVVVQWNELWPFASSSPFGSDVAYPRHLLEPMYLKDPAKMKTHPYWRAPVGNGPYRFVEWVPGSHITVEAYDRWPVGGTPKVRRIVFRFILDSTVLTANVIAGNIDGTEIGNLSIDQMVEIERRNPRVEGHYTDALRWERIDFNLDNEWLRDKRVRQAIAYAIDRDVAVQALYKGKYRVSHSWLAPRHPAYNPNVRKYGHDPARARQLLAEAGFTPGSDGVLRDRAGKRFEMTFMTTAGHAAREQMQQIVKDHLRQVGIEIRIDNRPSSVFFGSITPRRQFPHLAMYTSVFSPESTAFDRFHSTQIPSAENNWEGNNRVGWRNAENDRLMEQIVTEMAEAKRNALFKRQQEIFADDLPSLPLFFSLSLTTMDRRVRFVKPTGLSGTFIAWNAWQWLVGDQ
jgi:peptide/nickel transport system substrate-binding protein